MDYMHYSSIFKALSDETRLKIIGLLSNGDLCACKILENFDITQPTLSYHMKILADCELVKCKKDGSWIKYSLNKQTFDDLKALSEKLDLKLNIKNTNTNDCDTECIP